MKVWAAVAVVLIGAGWFGYRAAYRAGYEAGSAAVRADWATSRGKDAEAATEALRAAYERYRAEIAKRDEVERGLETRLEAATARGRALAGRLRDVLAACRAPGPAGPADAPAGESGDTGGVGEALADHLAACERDAERFGELQRWLRP